MKPPPCWIDNMSEAAYRADPCERPSLTQSLANVLLSRSPWHAWRERSTPSESTEAQNEGTIVHALVFGGDDRIAVLDVKDYKTHAAQQLKKAAIAEGKIPVKAAAMDEYTASAETIRTALRSMDPGFELRKAKAGRVAIWEQDGVLCRGRVDCMVGSCIYELKTIERATDDSIERAIRDHGYHVQRAAYVSAAETIEPTMAGRIDYVLVFAEKETGQVVPVEMSGELAELGLRRWKRAVDAWGRCLRAGRWPGYANGEPRRIGCNEWALARDQDEEFLLRERMMGI